MTEHTPAGAETVARWLLASTAAAMDPLLEALARVPDERLVEQPVPEQLPVGKMIEHAFGAVAFTSRALRLGACRREDVVDLLEDDERTGTRGRIREVEALARHEIDGAREVLDGSRASGPIEFWLGWSLTGVQTAALGYEELVHHRGQVQSFLRLMGLEPPDIHDLP